MGGDCVGRLGFNQSRGTTASCDHAMGGHKIETPNRPSPKIKPSSVSVTANPDGVSGGGRHKLLEGTPVCEQPANGKGCTEVQTGRFLSMKDCVHPLSLRRALTMVLPTQDGVMVNKYKYASIIHFVGAVKVDCLISWMPVLFHAR